MIINTSKLEVSWRSFEGRKNESIDTGLSGRLGEYLIAEPFCECLTKLLSWEIGLYSTSARTKISWSLEPMELGFRLFQSIWNLTGT